MAETPAKPNPTPAVPDRIKGPPDESFEEKYNSHYEFPLSIVGSLLMHVMIAAVLAYLILVLMGKGEDKSPVAVKTMAVGGMDDLGDGSAGSGGKEDPLIEKMNIDPATAAEQSLADPSKLPEIKEDIKQTIKLIDPTGNMPVSASNAAAYAGLDKAIRDKLLGAQRGAGNEAGKGTDGTKGTGPGGTGSNSTLGRNMRWTLRFKVNSGRDYLDQLKAMDAQLLIPIPGTDKCIHIKDLNDPSSQKTVDPAQFGDLLKFVDSRADAVNGVIGALGLPSGPRSFCAVFTKDREAKLAKMETSYRNRRAEDIEETIFKVTIRGGEPEIVVDEQKVKR
ncbi:MAG: hypothetical protein K8U57_36925 [Planctomycetes bacterium]|nr:hypothetical protein [Planctomycetota bacterium]